MLSKIIVCTNEIFTLKVVEIRDLGNKLKFDAKQSENVELEKITYEEFFGEFGEKIEDTQWQVFHLKALSGGEVYACFDEKYACVVVENKNKEN